MNATLTPQSVAAVTWETYLVSLGEFASGKYIRSLASYWHLYINPVCGQLPISHIRLGHIQSVIQAGFIAGLSRKSLQLLRGAMSGWLRFCRSYELTALRCDDVRIPRAAHKGTRRILTSAELKKLLSAVPGDLPETLRWWLPHVQFLAISGLRPGELIGLQWSDLTHETLLIQRSINVEGQLTPGKTEAARRAIPLCAMQQQILQQQRRSLMLSGCGSMYIFPSPEGGAVREQRLYRAWLRIQSALGLPGISLYELRHTFISLCKDTPLSALKLYVGHTPSMRTETYIHPTDRDRQVMRPVVNKIDELTALAGL